MVYVSELRPFVYHPNIQGWEYADWCALIADSSCELVAFGCSIGLCESWLHYPPFEHCEYFKLFGRRWREKAVKAGAVELGPKAFARKVRARPKGWRCPQCGRRRSHE